MTLTLFFTALALSMDSLAVSIGLGMSCAKVSWRRALKLASIFALFQAFMPWIGYGLGQSFQARIAAYDHWIVFGVMSFLGLKMIRESFDQREASLARQERNFRIPKLAFLALATSIDASAAGLGFALLHVDPFQATL